MKTPLVSAARVDPFDILSFVFLVPLTLWTLLVAGLSLRWELHWDALVMHYLAFLVNEKGFVPYRDTFDNNMFGVPILHTLIGRVFGYDDLELRIFDLLWLSALSACTWAILRQVDWRAAWAGVVLFAWLYLSQDQNQLLQRDYLTVLPMAAALLLALNNRGKRSWLRSLLIGVLMGVAATIKPPALIVAPLLAGFEPPTDDETAEGRAWWKRLLLREVLAGLGCFIPVAAGLLWLWTIGALPSFLEIVTRYYPLYTGHVFDGTFHSATPEEKRAFVLHSILTFRGLAQRELLLVAAALVALIQLFSPVLSRQRKALVGLLAGLALTQYLGIVIVGNFHPYSWIALLYLVILLVAIAFARPLPVPNASMLNLALPFVAILSCTFTLGRVPENVFAQLRGDPPATRWTERSDEMTRFLAPRLRPGDRVQPLDHLGGTARVLLQTRAELASRFAEDIFFYLASDQAYIQELRHDFLLKMQREPPRFVIEVTTNRLPTARKEGDDFDRLLRSLLQSRYHPVLSGEGYVIYERNERNPNLLDP